MMNSVLIQVVIGIVLAYSLLSIVVSQVNTLLAGWLKFRSSHLRAGLAAFIRDKQILQKIYEHPLIGLTDGGKPTDVDWVDTAILVKVLIETVEEQGIYSERLRRTLEALTVDAAKLLDASEYIQKWVDTQMDIMTGLFKRQMLYFSLGIGLMLAVLLNIDSIQMAEILWKDPTLRESLVAAADTFVAEHGGEASTMSDTTNAGDGEAATTDTTIDFDSFNSARESVDALLSSGLPIGWVSVGPDDDMLRTIDPLKDRRNIRNLYEGRDLPDLIAYDIQKLIGWALTALAISLGADFWFNALRRLMGR